MPPRPKKQKPICVACGDTGVNSRGGTCTPCMIRRGSGDAEETKPKTRKKRGHRKSKKEDG
jgi:hypothetical protein